MKKLSKKKLEKLANLINRANWKKITGSIKTMNLKQTIEAIKGKWSRDKTLL